MNRLFALVLALFALAGCRTEEVTYSTYASRDFALCERFSSDIWEVMDRVARDTEGIRRLDCIEHVEVDTLSSPMTLLIDFGSGGECVDLDDVVRTGRIRCTFNGRYSSPGTTINIYTDNYTVDGYPVDAVLSVVHQGVNLVGNISYDVHTEIEVTHPGDVWTATLTSDTYRELVEGDISSWWIDDVYEVTGSGEGVNRNGTSFKATIVEPLEIEVLCSFVKSGVVEVSPSESILRTLDYGNGECNATATVSVGNGTFTISQQ